MYRVLYAQPAWMPAHAWQLDKLTRANRYAEQIGKRSTFRKSGRRALRSRRRHTLVITASPMFCMILRRVRRPRLTTWGRQPKSLVNSATSAAAMATSAPPAPIAMPAFRFMF